MNEQQRASAAKFLYDLTKGVLLVTVVGNVMRDKPNIFILLGGFVLSIVFYFFAYQFEK